MSNNEYNINIRQIFQIAILKNHKHEEIWQGDFICRKQAYKMKSNLFSSQRLSFTWDLCKF